MSAASLVSSIRLTTPDPGGLDVHSARRCLDRIEAYRAWTPQSRRGRKLLGVGRSLQHLQHEANARGYDVTCVDSGDVTAGRFDACVLDDVAHSESPLSAIEWAWESLAPDGTVLAILPSSRQRDAKSGIPPVDKADTESLLVRGGFEHIRIVERGGSFSSTAIEVIGRKGRREPVGRRRPILSVVMPVFNERATFSTIATQLLAKPLDGLDLELIIVESNSTDGTREEVARFERDPRVRVIYEDRPRGKGHAVRAGLACATGDFVLIQDADLEYDLDDYGILLEPLRTYRQAFVLGSRHGANQRGWRLRRFTEQRLVSRVMNLAHVSLTLLFNVVYGTRLRDPFTMYKVFRRECLSGLTFESNRFDFDWELLAKLVRAGYRPVEIPVRYQSRSFTEGKKIRFWRDPLTWIRACLKYRVVPLSK